MPDNRDRQQGDRRFLELRPTAVAVEHRGGQRQQPLHLAVDGIVSHSVMPLRFASFLGLALSAIAVLAIAIYFVLCYPLSVAARTLERRAHAGR